MRKWTAKLSDGRLVSEGDVPWSQVEKSVVSLSLDMDGMSYRVPDGMESYLQGKTMSAPIGGGKATIMSRYIGFRMGGKEYRLRVDEYKPECRLEVT